MNRMKETAMVRLIRILEGEELGDPQDWRDISEIEFEEVRDTLNVDDARLRRFERGVEDLKLPAWEIALAYDCPLWAIREWRAACFGVLEQEQRRAA